MALLAFAAVRLALSAFGIWMGRRGSGSWFQGTGTVGSRAH